MPVLDAVHWVFLTFFFGQIEVKIHVRFRRVEEEEKPRRVQPDFVDQVEGGDDIPVPLADFDLLSLFEEFDELKQNELQASVPAQVVAQHVVNKRLHNR